MLVRKLLPTLLLIALVSSGCGSTEPPVFEPAIQAERGVAIGGYDAVAYHTEDAAVLGSAAHATDWQSATWHFSSAAHLDLFLADPHRYAPAYGGHCAFAASLGSVGPGDPEVFTVAKGRLYFNANPALTWVWSPPAVDPGVTVAPAAELQ